MTPMVTIIKMKKERTTKVCEKRKPSGKKIIVKL